MSRKHKGKQAMETQTAQQSQADEQVGTEATETTTEEQAHHELVKGMCSDVDVDGAEDDTEAPAPKTATAGDSSSYVRQTACFFVARNQRDVNAKMAGEDWLQKGSEHGEVDYSMAALDECQELWTCALNFKWWDRKSFVGDARNARMELVDLLHFITSEDLVAFYKGCSGEWTPADAETSISVIGSNMYRAAERCIQGVQSADSQPDLEKQFKRELKDFIKALASNSVDWGAFWGMVVTVDQQAWANPEAAVQYILDLYSAKATLNLFRTKHRNGPNGYRKVWIDGREDNDIMMAWLDSQPSYPGNMVVQQWLEEQYARIIHVR